MLARVARLEMHRFRVVILVVKLRRSRMIVLSRPVMVLRMIVRGVGVRVQRRDARGGAHEGNGTHDGDQTSHRASVWKEWCGGQTSRLLAGADIT